MQPWKKIKHKYLTNTHKKGYFFIEQLIEEFYSTSQYTANLWKYNIHSISVMQLCLSKSFIAALNKVSQMYWFLYGLLLHTP